MTRTLILDGVSEGEVLVVGPYKVLNTLEHGKALCDEVDVAKEKNAEDRIPGGKGDGKSSTDEDGDGTDAAGQG